LLVGLDRMGISVQSASTIIHSIRKRQCNRPE